MPVLNNLCKQVKLVTQLRSARDAPNPEAFAAFFSLCDLPFVCDFCKFFHLEKSLYSIHFALLSVLLFPAGCHFLAGSGVQGARQYLGYIRLTSMEGFAQWHSIQCIFLGKPRKGGLQWYVLLIKYFPCDLPVFKVDDLVSSKAWSQYEQGTGMCCLDGIIFLGLGAFRLQSFYSRETWSSFKTAFYQCLQKRGDISHQRQMEEIFIWHVDFK